MITSEVTLNHFACYRSNKESKIGESYERRGGSSLYQEPEAGRPLTPM